MGGKGRRRREKNYRAVHGGPSRLPPPPKPSQAEALPSKLRQIMSFTSNSLPDSAKVSKDPKTAEEVTKKKKERKVNEIKVKASEIKDGGDDDDKHLEKYQHSDSEEEAMQNKSKDRKKNKKRKRKQITDLRFENTVDKLGGSSKRREHKKKYFEAKKRKMKNAKAEEKLDFPGRENIAFGDVVEAPPKLVTVPKGSKTLVDASKERLRLQAIEAYRNRKAWTSRPGAPQLPPASM